MYRMLQFICRDSTQHSGLSYIEVPTNPTQDPKKCTDWTKINTPHKIAKYLLKRKIKHFGQAQGTSFTTFPLNVEIDFISSTYISKSILSGIFVPEDINKLMTLFLSHMKHKTKPDFLPEKSWKQRSLRNLPFGQKRQPRLPPDIIWDITAPYC
jgi:hypothetical protein